MFAQTAAIGWEAPLGVDSEAVRLRRGDPDALVALLERYQHRLYRYLLRMVHEPATAEDIFQQTWIRVAENVRRFDPNRGIEPWLFSIARNLAIDYLRRMRPESLDAPLPSGQSRAETLPDPHVGAEPAAFEMLMREQRTSRLAEGVAELPAIYREIVSLRFEEEMKLEEIAETLDVPLSTVKTRLRRALEGLRVSLAVRLPGGELPGWRTQ
jgi:RNA polymerase sigma-70 factor (ECF subfamily)